MLIQKSLQLNVILRGFDMRPLTLLKKTLKNENYLLKSFIS